MPSHHVGSLDAWLDSPFANGGGIGSSSLQGYHTKGRSRASPLSGAQRATSAGGRGVVSAIAANAPIGSDCEEDGCSPLELPSVTRADALGPYTLPLPLMAPMSSGDMVERSCASLTTAHMGRPPAGPSKRQSLLSQQLRSASSAPLDSCQNVFASGDVNFFCAGSRSNPSGNTAASPMGCVAIDPMQSAMSAQPGHTATSFAAYGPITSSKCNTCDAVAPRTVTEVAMAEQLGASLTCGNAAAAAVDAAAASFTADRTFPMYAASPCRSSGGQLLGSLDADATTCGGSMAYSSSGGGVFSSGSNILHCRDDCSHEQLGFSALPTATASFVSGHFFGGLELPASSSLPDAAKSDAPDGMSSLSNAISSSSHSAVHSLARSSFTDTAFPASSHVAADKGGALPTTASSGATDGSALVALPGVVAVPYSPPPAHRGAAAASLSATAAAVAAQPRGGGERGSMQPDAGDFQSPFQGLLQQQQCEAQQQPVVVEKDAVSPRRGSKGVSFASLFSTVLVLPSAPTDNSRSALAANRYGFGSEGGAGGRLAGHGYGRSALHHSVSVGHQLSTESALATFGQEVVSQPGSARAPGSPLSAAGGAARASISGLLESDVAPALYEGTVRRGLPRKALLARAMSQPVTEEMYGSLMVLQGEVT